MVPCCLKCGSEDVEMCANCHGELLSELAAKDKEIAIFKITVRELAVISRSQEKEIAVLELALENICFNKIECNTCEFVSKCPDHRLSDCVGFYLQQAKAELESEADNET